MVSREGAPAPAPRKSGEAGPRAPGRRGYFGPALTALGVLLAIALALGAGDLSHPRPRTLHGGEVADQIAFSLQSAGRRPSPPSVVCPPSEPVRQGLRFTRTAVLPGRSVALQVVEIDGRGHLRWHAGSSLP